MRRSVAPSLRVRGVGENGSAFRSLVRPLGLGDALELYPSNGSSFRRCSASLLFCPTVARESREEFMGPRDHTDHVALHVQGMIIMDTSRTLSYLGSTMHHHNLKLTVDR